MKCYIWCHCHGLNESVRPLTDYDVWEEELLGNICMVVWDDEGAQQ